MNEAPSGEHVSEGPQGRNSGNIITWGSGSQLEVILLTRGQLKTPEGIFGCHNFGRNRGQGCY